MNLTRRRFPFAGPEPAALPIRYAIRAASLPGAAA